MCSVDWVAAPHRPVPCCVQRAEGTASPSWTGHLGSSPRTHPAHLEVRAHQKNGVSGQFSLRCGSRQPSPAPGWMWDLRVNSSMNNDTILQKCSISRIQLLELCLGEEGPEGVLHSGYWWFFAPGIWACVVCVLFHRAHIFRCSHGPFLGVSWGKGENTGWMLWHLMENITPLSAGLRASSDSFAFRPNQSPAGEHEPTWACWGGGRPPSVTLSQF